MTSMTGYGYAERFDDQVHVVVEVKSVNNRYLDVNVSLPPSLGPLEPDVRETVAGAAARGRVDVFVRLRELQEDLAVYVDRSALAGYVRALEELRREIGADEPVRLEHVLAFDGVIKSERGAEGARDRDRYWGLIEPLLREALQAFTGTRLTEGDKLQADISAQLARVEEALRAIGSHAGDIEAGVRRNLAVRFNEVVGDAVEESRMLAEVAAQLTRFSINEEIVRLTAHLESFRASLGTSGVIGKRLDFLCQEMHREINTIGSKSVVLAISQHVVDAKDALENLREQLRNVE